MASETSGGPSRSQKPKVIYVMGAGRSGSTILGVMLGNCSDFFFAGELDKWVGRRGEPKRTDRRRVEFWSDVRARVADPSPLRAGQPHRHLERSSALFRRRRRRARRGLAEPYVQLAGELYEAVASVAGATYLVDTSHYPLRARELQSLQSVDLYLLLLVRDPREVVASFARDDVVERRFNPLTTRVYLLLTYLLSAWVFAKHPRERRMVLSYEDLVNDPEGIVRDLLDRVGSSASLPDFTKLATGIPLHGNRLVGETHVSLRRSAPAAGRESLPARLFTRSLAGAVGRLRPRVSAARPRESAHSHQAAAAR